MRLYGAPDDPGQDALTAIMTRDLQSDPDLVLVMGTSIAITGIQVFLKTLKKVSSRAVFIFVNRTPPPSPMSTLR